MAKLRSIAKKETPSSNPIIPPNNLIIRTESTTASLPLSSPTRFIMPKHRADINSNVTATTIEVPSNVQITAASSMKRSAEPVNPSARAKRTRVIKPKIEPALNAQPVVHMEPLASTGPAVKKERLIASVPLNVQSDTPKVKIERVKKEPKPRKARVLKAKPEPKVNIASASSSKVEVELAPKKAAAKKEPAAKKKPAQRGRKPKAQKFTLPLEARAFMSDAMRRRALRAMEQRMFVISRELFPNDESSEKFEVLGSIGNNYTVSITSHIKCTCMDYALRRVHCKHILMVLFKVYRLPCNSQMFQSLYTTKEQRIEARSHGRIVDPSVLVPPEIRQKIMSITYKNHPDAAPTTEEPTIERRPLDTSDCPICFEEFEEANIAEIDFCKTCGNNVHKECFKMWATSKGVNVTCVYCRSKWVVSEPKNTCPKKNSVRDLDREHVHEGYYANFAKELGIERKRDTSTYKTHKNFGYDCGYC